MQGMTSLCIKLNMNLWTSISIKAFSPSYVIFPNMYCDNPRTLGVSFGFCVVVCAVLCSAGADRGNWLHDLPLGPVSLAVKAFFFLQRVSHLLSDSFCYRPDLDTSFTGWISSATAGVFELFVFPTDSVHTHTRFTQLNCWHTHSL